MAFNEEDKKLAVHMSGLVDTYSKGKEPQYPSEFRSLQDIGEYAATELEYSAKEVDRLVHSGAVTTGNQDLIAHHISGASLFVSILDDVAAAKSAVQKNRI